MLDIHDLLRLNALLKEVAPVGFHFNLDDGGLILPLVGILPCVVHLPLQIYDNPILLRDIDVKTIVSSALSLPSQAL